MMLRKSALTIGLLLCALSRSHAVSTDTILLSVTPGNIIYGVQITSPAAGGYDFGNVNVGATTISTKAISVRNAGNVGEYFSIGVSNSGPDGWSAVPSSVPGFNQFQLLGHIQTTGGSAPAANVFSVTTDTITVNIPSVAAGRYGQAGITDPGTTKDLFLKLTMPNAMATAAQQTMTVSINGQAN